MTLNRFPNTRPKLSKSLSKLANLMIFAAKLLGTVVKSNTVGSPNSKRFTSTKKCVMYQMMPLSIDLKY